MMRGERATMGKSLLDVQRELRIKASYIAAIENSDPSAFDTPGFIAGYVRSYARYLGMDPDEAFAHFCAESGFAVAHGMSEQASSLRKKDMGDSVLSRARDPLADPNIPFAPSGDSFLSRIEPAAVGSTLVLLALIGGIGYGGWSVLQEVQRVQLAPVEQTPVVLSELDPLDAASAPSTDVPAQAAGVFTPPRSDAFDRLYRPQALDVPVLVARDAPISTLDPNAVGVFADASRTQLPRLQDSAPQFAATDSLPAIQAIEGVMVVAARPSWVRVQDNAGNVLHSGIMNAGETYLVPATAAEPEIKIGESSAVYFAVNGNLIGPAGPRGTLTEDLSLDGPLLVSGYGPADPDADRAIAPIMARLSEGALPLPVAAPTQIAEAPTAPAPQPRVLVDSAPGVTIIASRQAWVRVKSASGATLFEKIMERGDTYEVPQTAKAPTVRTGDAGAVYFAVNGTTYGPYGNSGAIADNLALSVDNVTAKMKVTDLSRNQTIAKLVAELNAGR
jgi:cytoskeletal protein RodZ